MNKRPAISIIILILMVLTACDKDVPDPVFHISGAPDPIMYGCGNTLTVKVVGPSENVRVDSVFVTYNLFNGSGVKIKTGDIPMISSPAEPPTTYIGSVTLPIPMGSTDPSDLVSMAYFGEGKVVFGGFVDARVASSPSTSLVGHTEEKSIAVIPCPPTPTPLPRIKITIVPPFDLTIAPKPSTDKPKPGGGGVLPPPPSCNTDPNNPSCVP
jgi:hypothetical protein